MQAIAVPNGQGVLPSASDVENARTSLIASLPDRGFGDEKVREHINGELVPGLNRSSKSPNYYGFVIGGATPVAAFADNVVTEHDQNVHVHLPKEVITTDVEDRALTMVCELLDLKPSEWPHRTFSTGATASNTIGLACGREHVVAEAARRIGRSASVAEDGILEAMRTAELDYLQILTTVPHSSLRKSASVVGLGRAYVKDVGQSKATHLFDMSALEALMSEARTASIVAISYSDVNTGLFATDGQTMHDVRRLCDKYGAWIHVDAAFGLLARCLPQQHDYSVLLNGVAGLELADSITGDAHKMINVPYDCGIFLSRHLNTGIQVFHNPNAAYLNTASTERTSSQDRTIPSPINIGIENSRRFRALPVYATLAAYGRDGYREMLERQIGLARAIASFIIEHEGYELLPKPTQETSREQWLSSIFMIVLFRAKDDKVNAELVQRANETRKLYVSGTQWDGAPAARFAVANWQVNVDRDLKLVKSVLDKVLRP